MPAVSLSGEFNFQAFTSAGLPAASYRVYTYSPGTTTKVTVYTDISGTVAHTYTSDGAGGEYIATNSRGELPAPMFFPSGGADVVLKTNLGVSVWTRRASVSDVAGQLASDGSASTGAGMVAYDSTISTYPDQTVGKRIHRDYVYVSDMGGTDPTGTVDNTAQVLAAIATGKLVRLDGFYRVTGGSISLAGMPGIIGDGSLKSGLKVYTAGHAITIPSNAGYGRRALRLENFAIDSVGNACDGHYAIYAPGVASGAAAAYNSGLNVRGLDIGVSGRMGGGFYLKDFFRVNVEDIGFNSVSLMVRIVGSVVQGKFSRLTANNDAPATTLSQYGISTESASYSSGTLVPENLAFENCSYILGKRGINHTAGRDVRFINFDSETDDYGAVLNASCVMEGGIILPSPSATSFVGLSRGVNISTPDEGTDIIGVEIQMSRAPSGAATSYGFDIGDGTSPVYGLYMERCKVRGENNALQHAIRARQLFDATIRNCYFRPSVMIDDDIAISGIRRLLLENNQIPLGTISVDDGGEASAYGAIVGNQCATLDTTVTTADNWTISQNEPASTGGNTRLVGEAKGTFNGTLTGCTTSPTGTFRYVLQGRQVTLFVPTLSGTSNTTAATITGMPSNLYPNRQQDLWGSISNSATTQLGAYRIDTSGVITLYVGSGYGSFAGSGTKGTQACTITYSLE